MIQQYKGYTLETTSTGIVSNTRIFYAGDMVGRNCSYNVINAPSSAEKAKARIDESKDGKLPVLSRFEATKTAIR